MPTLHPTKSLLLYIIHSLGQLLSSGAGKTETTKLCLSFLSEMASADVGGSQGMEQKILASNPILESFGNAKTLRNNNSSRYGKFINLIFNQEGILQGCVTKNFLLEKSRVHMQAFGERSYHIFYQLCRASIEEADCFSMGGFGDIMKRHEQEHYNASATSHHSASMRANLSSLGLQHPDEFNYLNQSGCTDIYLVSDQESFHEMEFAATKLGFSKKQLNVVFSACACVLHLGNLTFTNNEDAGGCTVEQTDTCWGALCHVAALLDVSETQVVNALTKKELRARGEVTLVLLNATQANETRDALAKAIYIKCFDFLIHVINEELSVEAFQGRHASEITTTIGVLDIYGFEVFDMNGFEQLFINFANEKLQQHFNHHTFEEEIKACERENISCEDFTYLDNQETLNLIESKSAGRGGGILKILDDECKFPRGTDEAFLNKLKNSHKDNPLISFSRKFTDLGFDIVHYAGSVNYTVKDFVEKNKDTLSDDLEQLMDNSAIKELSGETMHVVEVVGRAKARQLTVAGKFQKDLNNLLAQLNASEPHFIRCIKPNEEKEPMIFNHALVHTQLKQSGAFDALSIRKRGYQFQFPHAVFMQRYRPLVVKHQALDPNKSMRSRCVDLITALSAKIPGMGSLSTNMQVGDSMVFWKSAEDVMLSGLRKEIVRAAVLTLQRFIRGGVTRCRVLRVQKVIRATKAMLQTHKQMLESGELVTFDSECETFQALTIQKDFFDTSNYQPYIEKELAEVLQALEERIDCINQLQLHQHKSLKNIDEGWLAATEKAIALKLNTVESVHMISVYNKELKNHGHLLVSVLKQIQSSDVEVADIQKGIATIDEIRKEDPEFAIEISNTLKKNVVQLEEENKLVSEILQTTNADVADCIAGDKDHFLPFQQHMEKFSDSDGDGLSRNFQLVLKVVDYVVELRDIVLSTLICATGEDPSVVPLFPPPKTPKGINHPFQHDHLQQQQQQEEEREVDFDHDEFENAAIVDMSGHVSTKAIESELWSASMKHFHLFDEIKGDLDGMDEFQVVIDLAAQEVSCYKEAVTMCHSVVQECGTVLSSGDLAQSATTRQNIDAFNEYIDAHCKLLTTSSSESEDDADNSSHPYFSKRVDIKNKKLLGAQYSLLLQMEESSRREKSGCEGVTAAASACARVFAEGDYAVNQQHIASVRQAVEDLKVCHQHEQGSGQGSGQETGQERGQERGQGNGLDGFIFPTTENFCKAAEYMLEVRFLANEVLVNPKNKKDTDSLNELEGLLMKSNMYEGVLDSFITQEELDSFREQAFNCKVQNNKLMDGKKQFTNDLERAVENEDEGLLTFLLGKMSSHEFEIDDSLSALVAQGKLVLDKYQELKRIVHEASQPDSTATDIEQALTNIHALSCKGSGPMVETLQARLDILLHCGQRIHSAWYDSPNSVENMVGALQACKQHHFPACDDVAFVQRFVDLWREDYALYLKALIDLRTFLEDTEAVNELNEELNKLYMKDKSMDDDTAEEEEEEYDEPLPGAGARYTDVGNRITEDFPAHRITDALCSEDNESDDKKVLSQEMNGLSLEGQSSARPESLNSNNTNDNDFDMTNDNRSSSSNIKNGSIGISSSSSRNSSSNSNNNRSGSSVDKISDDSSSSSEEEEEEDVNNQEPETGTRQEPERNQEQDQEQEQEQDSSSTEEGGPLKRKKKVFRRVTQRNTLGRRARANSDNYVERNLDTYKWYKYPKLRTFTDPERERQRKVYTTKNIPTSVSRLDNIIHIQLATAAFKCLLGIMGDKVGTYPEMLKKEFLRIATYHTTLTDELYCQVMKQLTKNPNHVSKAKGVDLLQLLVSAVLPTPPLLPYLENFLRSHGALEFVNLLRVLASKTSAKTDKSAEHDNEGWLFITVGRIMKSYRKRWCVLHGDSLSMFMTKDHNSKIETLPISQIKSLHYLKKKDENVKAMYAFEIEMKNDKKHVFYAV